MNDTLVKRIEFIEQASMPDISLCRSNFRGELRLGLYYQCERKPIILVLHLLYWIHYCSRIWTVSPVLPSLVTLLILIFLFVCFVLLCFAVRSSWFGLQERFAGEKQHSDGGRLWTCTWYLRKRHVWNYFRGEYQLWWGLLLSLEITWTFRERSYEYWLSITFEFNFGARPFVLCHLATTSTMQWFQIFRFPLLNILQCQTTIHNSKNVKMRKFKIYRRTDNTKLRYGQ